eukprot:12044882-Alexandrium_andersonii.AAC.1
MVDVSIFQISIAFGRVPETGPFYRVLNSDSLSRFWQQCRTGRGRSLSLSQRVEGCSTRPELHETFETPECRTQPAGRRASRSAPRAEC